jgi:hypothetical protein
MTVGKLNCEPIEVDGVVIEPKVEIVALGLLGEAKPQNLCRLDRV